MTPVYVNLLPAKRMEAIRMHRAVRWWILGGCVYTGLLAIGGLAYSINAAVTGMHSDQSTVVSAKLDAARAQREQLARRVTDLRSRVDAAQSVGHHPNWSVMLQFMASERGEGIAFERCELRRVEEQIASPRPASDAPPTTEAPKMRTRLQLRVTGLSDSLAGVHHFVEKLESSKVFDRVELDETGVADVLSPALPAPIRFTITGEIIEIRAREHTP
jgi:hypothetical protein